MVRRGVLLGLGAVWWWAVARLAVTPGAGALEGAVAAGGWGLSLLPVHCAARARAAGAMGTGRWRAAWAAAAEGGSGEPEAATKASPRRRSGGGSVPS
ncbi:hypothetical protein [Streptomyces sp. NPDC002588]|uniref:hypothetical protein n=1 Tax=Streptomyces sp. NPDC002588 TaxID=3154419 RepID=UPI00332CF244